MKKVAILTLNGNFNVGNRLQNYALEKSIINFGFDVESLWFEDTKEKIVRKTKTAIFYILNFQKKKKFLNFSKKLLHIHYYKRPEKVDEYDYFIVGSDQVWNYNFNSFNNYYLLDFVKKGKKISYAASIGVDKIEDNYDELFKDELMKFNKISVRETQAKIALDTILEKKKDIQVVLDPTMLLGNDEWKKIEEKPKGIPSKFVFCYFLGKNEKIMNNIKKFAKENECKIIDILDKESPFFNMGPREFLYLERNAFMVFTDSFHSCVFSILFKTPFHVFKREDNEKNMISRIETLLKTFSLEKRLLNDTSSEFDTKCDFSQNEIILEKERNKSFEFLKEALDLKEKE